MSLLMCVMRHIGVQRGLVGEIIKRFEQRGYQLLALELLTPSKELLEEHASIAFFIILFMHVADTVIVIPENLVQGLGW